MIVFRRLLPIFAASLVSVGVAHAAPAETPEGTVVSLTPEQVEAAKEAAAQRNMKADTTVVNGGRRDRQIHGEAGFAIGTGGYRSVFGTAVMPLGQDGTLALSFENAQADPVQYWYRRR